jgi:hypothetical protein
LKLQGTLIDLIDLDRASVPSSPYSTREISVREPQPGDRTKKRAERSNSKKLRKPNRRRRYRKKEREKRKKREGHYGFFRKREKEVKWMFSLSFILLLFSFRIEPLVGFIIL